MRFFLFFMVLILPRLAAQTPDCLPTPLTWRSEQLRGSVKMVWEREWLPDSSIWEERQYDYDTDGYLVRASRWDTARHLHHLRYTVYEYTDSRQIRKIYDSETQQVAGTSLSEKYHRVVAYTYDKNGRFLLEQVIDSEQQDTSLRQFLYRAGGWMDACTIQSAEQLDYRPRQPLYSYRYQREVCMEKINYYFKDHQRHQQFVYDSLGRLAQERWLYQSRQQETQGDTLARFVLSYLYQPKNPFPTALQIADYYQKNAYFDAIPADRHYEYGESDSQGNWLKKTIRYNEQQVHRVERKIVYY